MFAQKGKQGDMLNTSDNQFRETAGFKPFTKASLNQQQIQNNVSNKTTYNNRSSMHPYSEQSDNDALQYSESNIFASNKNVNYPQKVLANPKRLEILTNNNSILRESSVLFMSKLHLRPFNYGRFSENLNINMLENINIDQIEYTQDLSSVQKMLKNIAFSEFNTETVENMGYNNFNKIFRLWQLAIQNYGVQQQEEQQKGEKLYTKYRSTLDASQKIDELKKTHADKKTKLYEQIKTLQWQINELKQLSQKQGRFKCTYCPKMFENKEDIRTHIKASHKDKIEKIKEEQKAFENFGNPLSTLTRREERQLHEENQQLAQKVAKEVEEKMAEQLKILFEKHNELQKKKRIEEERNEYNQDTNYELAENQNHLLNSISKMNNIFGGFEDMFSQMQVQQQTLIEEQNQYNIRLREIQEDQRKLEQEKEMQGRDLQEQIKKIQQSQQKQLQRGGSGYDEEMRLDELQLGKEPSFGNPYMNQSRNPNKQFSLGNQRRKTENEFLLQEVEEDENKENFLQSRNSRSPQDQYYQSQSQMTNTMQAFSNYFTQNDSQISKKSDLKKQFKDKYISESIVQVQDKKQDKMTHIGELESDYDSDLLDESYEEDVIKPTNQHEIVRKAELDFKEKLMTEDELNNIKKNKKYRQAVLQKDSQADSGKKRTNVSSILTKKDDKNRNDLLIEEVIQMEDNKKNRKSHENIDLEYGLFAQQQDIQKMKQHFIQNQLQFQFGKERQDIDDLNQDEFEKLKDAYQQKYNPKTNKQQLQ